MDRMVDIRTGGHGSNHSSSSCRRSLATYDTANSGSLCFLNTHIPTTQQPPIGMESILSSPHTVSNALVRFQNSSRTPSPLLGPCYPSVQFQRAIFTPFSRVLYYRFSSLLRAKQLTSQLNARCTHNNKKRDVSRSMSLFYFV